MLTEREILDEIDNIIRHDQVHGSAHVSRQSGRKIFDSLALPDKLSRYIRESRQSSLSEFSKLTGISAQTLSSILNGRSITENMLFRLRTGLEYAIQHPGLSVVGDRGDVFLGDWRTTDTEGIQSVINNVALHLVALKRAIETSNSLNGGNSPIDAIQIAQLVALLESTLAAIKAPLVNVRETSGFFRWLRTLGKRAVEKGVEEGVSAAIHKAVDAGGDLLDNLEEGSVISDLGSIIT
ncbi:helix-turn-helix transcriptional regulator [Bradyrhizobium sp. DN5]|uniref:helix-turn-helix domain-containing protein n=1 Tax=Bradyrhizobium sp. DN5 TaxID=3056950 RepID=UPI003525822F